MLKDDDVARRWARGADHPGMAVTAEIKTGRRRVIDYLLAPLREYVHDGLRER